MFLKIVLDRSDSARRGGLALLFAVVRVVRVVARCAWHDAPRPRRVHRLLRDDARTNGEVIFKVSVAFFPLANTTPLYSPPTRRERERERKRFGILKRDSNWRDTRRRRRTFFEDVFPKHEKHEKRASWTRFVEVDDPKAAGMSIALFSFLPSERVAATASFSASSSISLQKRVRSLMCL